jgi:hypothetical protein
MRTSNPGSSLNWAYGLLRYAEILRDRFQRVIRIFKTSNNLAVPFDALSVLFGAGRNSGYDFPIAGRQVIKIWRDGFSMVVPP